jgi:hypothetical protein
LAILTDQHENYVARGRPKKGSSFMPEQLFVSVTFDPARGYVAVHPEISPVVALSLDGIRRKIESMSLSDKARVILQLDHSAQLERDRRRRNRV